MGYGVKLRNDEEKKHYEKTLLLPFLLMKLIGQSKCREILVCSKKITVIQMLICVMIHFNIFQQIFIGKIKYQGR